MPASVGSNAVRFENVHRFSISDVFPWNVKVSGGTRAKVITPLKESGLVKFLNIASQNDSWVVVEKLIIRAGRNDRIEMELSAFYLPKEGIL